MPEEVADSPRIPGTHRFRLTSPDATPYKTKIFLDDVEITPAVTRASLDYDPRSLHRLHLTIMPALELDHDVVVALDQVNGFAILKQQAETRQAQEEFLQEQGYTVLPSGVVRTAGKHNRIHCHGRNSMIPETDIHDCDWRAIPKPDWWPVDGSEAS